jgi:hypothetical protein
MRWFWLSRSPEIQLSLGPVIIVTTSFMSLRFQTCFRVVDYQVSWAKLAATVSYIIEGESVVSVSCISRHRALRFADTNGDDGHEAPIVFHSKENEKYTAREDDCILLLRTCTQDQAPDIQRK